MQESIVFLVRVQCRRKESSRSLSHLLMSFLSKLFHCQNRENICNNISTKDLITSVLKATTENKTSEIKRPTLIVTKLFIYKQNFRETLTKCI